MLRGKRVRSKRKSNLSKKKKQNGSEDSSLKFVLRPVEPKTENQRVTFEAYKAGKNLLLHGFAGTGKSFISFYLSLKELLSGISTYDKITLIRSVVPSRDIGFLPGSVKEKIRIFEEPYRDLCTELFSQEHGYDHLKLNGLLEFTTTSYLRGITFYRTIVIVDECQNMTFAELDTVLTRAGENCKMIFCGDFRQTDLRNDSDKQGLKDFTSIIRMMNKFDHIEFNENDILRSGLVRDYIIARTKYYDETYHSGVGGI
jgi:phosphate starvation-inducible protein PhoH and related proteins